MTSAETIVNTALWGVLAVGGACLLAHENTLIQQNAYLLSNSAAAEEAYTIDPMHNSYTDIKKRYDTEVALFGGGLTLLAGGLGRSVPGLMRVLDGE